MADFLKACGLALPLAIFALVTGYASLPAEFRWSAYLPYSPTYPVRVDLSTSGAAIVARDRARARSAFEAARLLYSQRLADQVLASQAGDEVDPLSASGPDNQGSLLDFADAAQAGRTDVPQLTRPGGLMAIDFDLAQGMDSSGAIEVRKDLQYQGHRLGSISVKIDSASSVFVSRAELLRILPESRSPNRSLDGEYVALSRLRSAGVDLRYDPVRDVFVVGE